ncbi:MAG: DUF2254 domain-containing protein [Gammaproteobacteria bacterium]
MRSRLLRLWFDLRTNFWFVPGLCLIAAVLLAAGMMALDHGVHGTWPFPLLWLQIHDPATARTVLATIASSMITVVSLVFSLTMVVLVLASSQFGSRLVQTFIGNRSTQWVLGLFVGTFLYCLLVLFLERSAQEGTFAAQFSSTAALALAALSVLVLVFFFHDVAQNIQAESVIASVSRQLDAAVERLMPAGDDAPAGAGEPDVEALPPERMRVVAIEEGYLQGVDYEGLAELAREFGAVILVSWRPGEFVIRGGTLAVVRSEKPLEPQAAARVQRYFVFGLRRSPLQDVEYAIFQLVEVAVRALSPGVNDPFTAMACIDRLGAGIARLATRRAAPGEYRDAEGVVRVRAKTLPFPGYVHAAFSQIRQHARGDVAVLGRLLLTLTVLAPHLEGDIRRVALRDQADMVKRAAQDAVPEGADLKRLLHLHEEVLDALGTED